MLVIAHLVSKRSEVLLDDPSKTVGYQRFLLALGICQEFIAPEIQVQVR